MTLVAVCFIFFFWMLSVFLVIHKYRNIKKEKIRIKTNTEGIIKPVAFHGLHLWFESDWDTGSDSSIYIVWGYDINKSTEKYIGRYLQKDIKKVLEDLR